MEAETKTELEEAVVLRPIRFDHRLPPPRTRVGHNKVQQRGVVQVVGLTWDEGRRGNQHDRLQSEGRGECEGAWDT